MTPIFTPILPLFIGNIGPMGMLIIAIVVLVLFGRGKITNLMGEVGKGITAFRKGVDDGKAELEEAMDASDTAKDVTPKKPNKKDKS